MEKCLDVLISLVRAACGDHNRGDPDGSKGDATSDTTSNGLQPSDTGGDYEEKAEGEHVVEMCIPRNERPPIGHACKWLIDTGR